MYVNMNMQAFVLGWYRRGGMGFAMIGYQVRKLVIIWFYKQLNGNCRTAWSDNFNTMQPNQPYVKDTCEPAPNDSHVAICQFQQAFNSLRQNLSRPPSPTLHTLHTTHTSTQSPLLTTLDLDRLCQLANLIAMHCLKTNLLSKAQCYLKRALHYCRHSTILSVITHNNLSCYHKKTSNPVLALKEIKKAIRLADKCEDFTLRNVSLLSDCYLNMCAILSSQGQHRRALKYASHAVRFIEDNLAQFEELCNYEEQKLMDRKNVLVIAKFNKAAELEHLGRVEEALQEYRGLWDYIRREFKGQHPLSPQITKALRQLLPKTKPSKCKHPPPITCTTTTHFHSVNHQHLPSVLALRQRRTNTTLTTRKPSLDKLLNCEVLTQRGRELRRNSVAAMTHRDKFVRIL